MTRLRATLKGNYDPNETKEELAARLAKIREFVDACNNSTCPDCKGTGKCDCGQCVNGVCLVCQGTGKW